MNPPSVHRELPPFAAFLLRLCRRLALAAAALVVLFLLLELACSRFLPRHSTRFLVDGEANGQPAWIDNQFFSYRFVPPRLAQPPVPVVALKNPPPGTLRVCLLGGSATRGDPDPSFGIGRQLELMLRSRYPDHPVEVVQMALDGGNSHVLREVARDLERLKPQAVVVMVGNEEIAGPYGPASTLGWFHHSSRIARLLVLFSRTHVSQLCALLLDRLAPARVDLNAWRSQEPITLKGRMSPNDPRLKSTYRSYRKNLRAILDQARAAAPVVIACTVPVNLRDCAPFLTSYLDDETAAQEVREMMRTAVAAETATNPAEASRLYADIIRRDPTHAEALFRAARLALANNQTAEAAALFSRARDADALRLRTDSRLNALVRECAAESSVSLLDAEALFALRSPQGIPGREFFLDHIHFTFAANHLLASALLDRLEFLRTFDPEPAGHVPAAGVLADEMLYEPWGHADQVEAILDQQFRAPFHRQLDNAAVRNRLEEEKRQLAARIAAITPDNTRAIFARRQSSRPDDAWLAARTAWYLFKAGALAQAEPAARTALERWPHRFEFRALLALIRTANGSRPDDEIATLRGTDADTGYFDITYAIGIGRALAGRQQYAVARPWLEYALRRDPWNSEAAIALAQTLYQLNGGPAAVGILQSAIERNPGNPLLWEELASIYCLLGRWTLSTQCFRKAEEIAPYRYERLLKWADALVRLKQYSRARSPISKYLAVEPDDPEALALRADIERHLPPKPEPDEPAEEEKSSRKFPWE